MGLLCCPCAIFHQGSKPAGWRRRISCLVVARALPHLQIHLEMSLLGARGMLEGPGMGAGTPSPSCTHFKEAQDTSDAHLRLCSLWDDVGIIPTSVGAELFH